jgi:hypothetical protein
MSPTLTIVSVLVFLLLLLFIAWLKYREHLHMHRREHGPHSDRTDFMHRGRRGR